ncbi:MAG: hypothetical protein GX594_02750 [Pirellulaceae bacterium]|nr:hypothetical protein [Pirellulaceae bacterium]
MHLQTTILENSNQEPMAAERILSPLAKKRLVAVVGLLRLASGGCAGPLAMIIAGTPNRCNPLAGRRLSIAGGGHLSLWADLDGSVSTGAQLWFDHCLARAE